MDKDLFLISQKASIKQALQKIQDNKSATIFLFDDDERVVAVVTDGDIRRGLLKGADLGSSVKEFANFDFIQFNQNISRESLLKAIDTGVSLIPVLDQSSRLLRVIRKDDLPAADERPVVARARAPARISFAGGGSDSTYYFQEHRAASISTTISMYSHVALLPRSDSAIKIHSADLSKEFVAEDLSKAIEPSNGFGLIQSAIKTVNPDFGFDLSIQSDFPVGSGLGGSAAVVMAILHCFNQFRRDKWNQHEFAELAYQAERIYFGVSGGWQDQYAAGFGGLNFMEFAMDGNVVFPLRLEEKVINELEESLLLCFTGTARASGDLHDDQRRSLSTNVVREKMEENVQVAYEIRDHLLRGDLSGFADSLNKSWRLKRKFSSKVTDAGIDDLYSQGLEYGATGGKLLGAGNGGYFLFFVPQGKRSKFVHNFKAAGHDVKSVLFEQGGVKSWLTRS